MLSKRPAATTSIFIPWSSSEISTGVITAAFSSPIMNKRYLNPDIVAAAAPTVKIISKIDAVAVTKCLLKGGDFFVTLLFSISGTILYSGVLIPLSAFLIINSSLLILISFLLFIIIIYTTFPKVIRQLFLCSLIALAKHVRWRIIYWF